MIRCNAEKSFGLGKDTDGAVALAGLFMALFLVGTLYFAIGIGETITKRERLQDAADETVFAAATTAARGMNMVSLTNMVMVGALAAVMSLDAIKQLSEGCEVWAGFEGIPQDQRYCGGLYDILHPTEQQALDALRTILVLGGMTNAALQVSVPFLARTRAITNVRPGRAPVQVVFIANTAQLLPVEQMPVNAVCDYAHGRFSVGFVITQRDRFPISGNTRRFLNSTTQTTTDAAKSNICSSLNTDVNVLQVQGGVMPGSDMVQFRAFSVTDDASRQMDRGVLVANNFQGGIPIAAQLNNLMEMGKVGFAQAEYAYADKATADDWMFRAGWQARLRRFRVGGLRGPELVAMCSISGFGNHGACGNAGTINLDLIRNAIIH